MNSQPNPLIPEGSFLEQKNRGRARVKIAVFFVLAVHGIGLMALLMQGCRREEIPPPADTSGSDTNYVAPTFDTTNQPMAPTNDPYQPTNEPGTDTNVVSGGGTTGGAITNEPAPGGGLVTPGGMTEYTIAKGDTFSTIAKKFNVSVKALQDANPTVAPTKLKINQKIMVPAPAAATGAPAAPAGDAAGPVVYTVKSGDTLSGIATRHKVTVRAIRAANNLRTDSIKVGQKLTIPAKPPGPATQP